MRPYHLERMIHRLVVDKREWQRYQANREEVRREYDVPQEQEDLFFNAKYADLLALGVHPLLIGQSTRLLKVGYMEVYRAAGLADVGTGSAIR